MSEHEPRPLPIAVALRYEGTGAPRVTAKGRAEVAERIVALAREHGVPLQEEPELASVLARIPLGDEIPEVLYRAVAEVLSFAYLLSGKWPLGLPQRPGTPSDPPSGNRRGPPRSGATDEPGAPRI
jgi:flagellar biosynthesis protein